MGESRVDNYPSKSAITRTALDLMSRGIVIETLDVEPAHVISVRGRDRRGEPFFIRQDVTPWPGRSVYFIQAVKLGHVKIGVANDVDKRFEALQCGSPDKLCVIAALPGAEQDERRLHKILAKHRLWGEWFEPADWLEPTLKQVRKKRSIRQLIMMLEARSE